MTISSIDVSPTSGLDRAVCHWFDDKGKRSWKTFDLGMLEKMVKRAGPGIA